MLDFGRFEWVSFDCYGTLVDWETGISSAVAGALEGHGVHKTRAEVLALFADAEPRVQSSGEYIPRDGSYTHVPAGPQVRGDVFREYRSVLRGVMEMIGAETGVGFSGPELGCLADTLPDWPVFPDVLDALRALKARYKLAIISNVDDDLFARTAQGLGVEFDAVVTSQQARSYKPDLRNFDLALERMGAGKERWLHVGESLYHDIGPANRLGVASVWVNRADRGGGTRHTDAVPDLVVPDLAALAEMAGAA